MHGSGIADILSWSFDVSQVERNEAHIKDRVHGSGSQQYIVTRESSPSVRSSSNIKSPNNHYYDQSLPINQSLNRSTNFLTNQPTITMKFTLAVAASMAATTMANPILSKHWGQRWGHNKAEGKPITHPHINRSIEPN